MKSCQHCGKEFKNQGGLNLHLSIHCKKKPGDVQAAAAAASAAAEEECKHEWRLLDHNVYIERVAYQKGYKGVCEKCQTLQ